MNYGQPPPSSGYGYGPQHYPHPGYGYPPAPGPVGPREHPQANTALGLGLAAVFCLGAVLGVPAILVGRQVLRDIAVQPHALRGAPAAKVGLVLGWISVVETGWFVGNLGTQNVVAGVAWMGVSLVVLTFLALSAVKGLPKPVALISGTLRRAPLAVGLSLAGLFLGGGFGVVRVVDAQNVAAQKCVLARGAYDDALKKDQFEPARSAINNLQFTCHATDREVASMRATVDTKQAEARQRAEAEAKAKAAAEAAEKERNAVASFPSESKDVAAKIKKAQQFAWQARWEDSDTVLTTAQQMLDGYKETSVADSKEYADLRNQIAAQRKTIQPQLDRIAEKRRQEAAAAAVRAAIRGPKPVNSVWDGSVSVVERAIKANMHDPSSYEHVGTTEPQIEGDYWVVITRFRGKNMFGAKVINTKKFYIQQGTVVKMSDVDGDE